jgi:hypothetical protein
MTRMERKGSRKARKGRKGLGMKCNATVQCEPWMVGTTWMEERMNQKR